MSHPCLLSINWPQYALWAAGRKQTPPFKSCYLQSSPPKLTRILSFAIVFSFSVPDWTQSTKVRLCSPVHWAAWIFRSGLPRKRTGRGLNGWSIASKLPSHFWELVDTENASLFQKQPLNEESWLPLFVVKHILQKTLGKWYCMWTLTL